MLGYAHDENRSTTEGRRTRTQAGCWLGQGRIVGIASTGSARAQVRGAADEGGDVSEADELLTIPAEARVRSLRAMDVMERVLVVFEATNMTLRQRTAIADLRRLVADLKTAPPTRDAQNG